MTQRAGIQSRPILDENTRTWLDAVDADPLAPVLLGVVAPGGYGKTTVLSQLEQIYERASVQVVTAWRPDIGDLCSDGETAVIIDDAHQLGEPQLHELCRLAESRPLRLAVAYRPWPKSTTLAELTELLGRTGPPLVLPPFDQDRVEALLATVLGAGPRPALVEAVHTQTGGVPGFVERAAVAIHDTGSDGGSDQEIPQAAISRFQYDIDRLDADVERFLLAVEAGVGMHMDLLGSLLRCDTDEVGDVMEAARATGMLGRDGSLLPISQRAIRTLIPVQRRISARARLAELQLERGAPVLELARSLLGTGIAGAAAAAVFQAAAEEALPAHPALAAELFAAAVGAGRPLPSVAAAWSGAAALAGDLDSALRLADQVISAEDAVDRAGGAAVAAAALAHRGQLGRSAELYRWSGTESSASFAVIGLLGIGERDVAERLLGVGPGKTGGQLQPTPARDGPPTLFTGAASLTARGVYASVAGSTVDALSALVRAAGLLEPAGSGVLLPDSPSALAALVGMNCGELSIAESVLARAIASNMGGALLAIRHRLLQAWIFMTRGQLATATDHLAMATRTTSPMEPRDWLFAVGLEVGLARRNSDLATLRRAWAHACEAVLRHPVDLFTLLPLAEFATAAARLRDQGRLAPHLREAHVLLTKLGNPPLWTATLHWHYLLAATITEQPEIAKKHASVLAATAKHSRYCAAVAAAAECWLRVMAGTIEPTAVEAAARGLHGVGLGWDGARLAGQAAIRTSDRKAMVSLLDCARVLQGKPTSQNSPGAPRKASGVTPAAGSAGDQPRLSDREREVARLVLEGLTYKQIGDRLFISAKTVEHHMARMRQRLGATSRTELLAQLRQQMDDAS